MVDLMAIEVLLERCAKEMWYQSRNNNEKLIAITDTQKVTLEREFQRYLKLAHRDVGDNSVSGKQRRNSQR